MLLDIPWLHICSHKYVRICINVTSRLLKLLINDTSQLDWQNRHSSTASLQNRRKLLIAWSIEISFHVGGKAVESLYIYFGLGKRKLKNFKFMHTPISLLASIVYYKGECQILLTCCIKISKIIIPSKFYKLILKKATSAGVDK